MLTSPTNASQEASLARLLDIAPVAARIALRVSGLAIFVPALLLLWFRRDQSSILDWLLLSVCLATWLCGQAFHSLGVRATIQLTAGICLLAGALLLAPLGGPGWIMPTTIAFAVIIGGTLAFNARPALLVVCIAAIADAVVTKYGAPTAAFTEDLPLNGFIGPLLDIIAGTGLILTRQATWRLFAHTDRKQRDLELAVERTARESRIQLARESVERRIHETVLNTLSGIAMGTTKNDGAQRAAQQDLRQLELSMTPMPEVSLSELIHLSVDAADLSPLAPAIYVENDAILSSPMASIFRDAIVEALRNIVLHSRASSVTITGNVDATISVIISDNGVGIAPDSNERFGLRNSIKAGMSSLGGEASIDSELGRGVTVTLTAPALTFRPLPPEPVEATRILDESLLSRIGLMATNVFLAVVAIPLSRDLPQSNIILVTLLLFATCNVLLAFTWKTWGRILLPLLAIAIASSLTYSLSQVPLQCTQSGDITWLITGISGGGALLMIRAYTSLPGRIAVIAAMAVISFALAASLPTECSTYAWSAALVNIVYMAAVTYFFSWLDLRFELNRARMTGSWQHAVEQRLHLEQRQVTAQEWNRLSSDAIELLTTIATGSADVDSPTVQSHAAAAASDLRARLGRNLSGHSADILVIPTTHALAAKLTPLGWTVESEVVVAPHRKDPYPLQLLDALVHLASHVEVSGDELPALTLTWLTDDDFEEVLLAMPGQLDMGAGQVSAPTAFDDCVVEVLAHAPRGLVSVRRPA